MYMYIQWQNEELDGSFSRHVSLSNLFALWQILRTYNNLNIANMNILSNHADINTNRHDMFYGENINERYMDAIKKSVRK